MLQKTLNAPITFNGIGLHTGAQTELTLRPAPENNGYTICRTDLPDKPTYNAWADYVTESERHTLLSHKEWSVATIEHCLSALYALEVDNCIIEVNGPEVPILDGCSAPYVRAIQEVGLKDQQEEREYFYITKKKVIEDETTGAKVILYPDDQLSVDVLLSFPSSPTLHHQGASLASLQEYPALVAPARTFVFAKDILGLLEHNLIKGGSLDNALVLNEETLPESDIKRLKSLFPAIPDEQLACKGALNPNPNILNEPALHKILDLLGDLALCGKFIKGHIVATAPGHSINTKVAKELRREIKFAESQAPRYNPDAEAVLDLKGIKSLLPHRFPFLLVDKIIDITENSVVGVKNVTNDEFFFQGHFPDEPVMPGVLIVEAMAQTGGVLVLKKLGEPKDSSTYFIKIDNVKFRHKVVPGDTLLFKLRMMGPIRRNIANMRGLAFVGNTLVCEAEFMAQIVINSPA